MNSLPVASQLFHVHTYGCQMNVYDSQKLTEIMNRHGYQMTPTPEQAHIIILNTCAVREKASEKVYSDLGIFRRFMQKKKDQGEFSALIVIGCQAQQEGELIFERAPFVDFVLGPQSYHKIPQFLKEHALGVVKPISKRVCLDFNVEEKFDQLPEEQVFQKYSVSSFVTIQEGCDKFCHFCLVPFTRGPEYSRPPEDIIREVGNLIEHGVIEVTLLGQNVNAYHGKSRFNEDDIWGLGKLLTVLEKTYPALERLRYTTSHPRDVDDELIQAHKNMKKLMPFLHLPVQSGSTKILQAMNRQYSRDFFLNIALKFKQARPDLVFSSDFIVGYPGETEEDFEDTLKLIDDMEHQGLILAQSFSFAYSPRLGTQAAPLDHISSRDKLKRLSRLQEKLFDHHGRFNEGCVGKTIHVLLEHKGKKTGQWVGRSAYMQRVYVDAPLHLQGKLKNVRITSSNTHSMTGVLLEDVA